MDDLKQRLNDLAYGTGSRSPTDAINRIEALERELAVAVGVIAESGRKRGEAEAKLAKAVEAIKEIKLTVDSSKVPIAGLIQHKCKIALAELEGKE